MSDTRKQRALGLTEGRPADPPVCMQTYLGLYLEPHRRRALAGVYRELLGGAPERALSFDERLEAELDAWQRAWAIFEHPPAWMPTRWSPVSHGQITRIAVRDGRIVAGIDGGDLVDVIDAPKGSTTDVWDRRETAGSLDPKALAPAWDARAAIESGAAELARRAVTRWGEDHLVYGATGAPFWSAYSCLGFAGLMETMRSDPGLLDEIIRRRLDTLRATLDVWAAARLECVFIEECLSSSDLISEADYLRFSLPAARDMLQHARELRLRTVYYYCGGIEGRIEHIATLPADVLAFEESKKGFELDLGAIRRELGPDRPLLGNIDAVLLRDADEASIRRAVGEQYEQAGPLLAASCGSPLPLDTEPGNLDIMVEAAQAYTSRRAALRTTGP